MGSIEENKALARRYSDAWSTRDIAVFEEILAPDFVDYMLGKPRSRQQLLVDAGNALLKDIRQEIDAIVAEGDTVAVHYATTATHTATARPISFTGMFILQIADGKIVGGWGEYDRLTIREQISGAEP